MSEHTPTPWKLSPWHIEEGPPAVLAPAGHIVCTTASDDDAEFIAKAVNNHDRLVRMVEDLLAVLDDAQSGFIPGTGYDLNWQEKRDSRRSDAMAILTDLIRPGTT